LDIEVAILKAIPGCSGVATSSYTGPILNKMQVQLKVQQPNGGGKLPINVHCKASLPTKLDAARAAKRRVAAIVGEELVINA